MMLTGNRTTDSKSKNKFVQQDKKPITLQEVIDIHDDKKLTDGQKKTKSINKFTEYLEENYPFD